ncbi:MAG: sensor domain-containing diguanylate cyclase, partial [Thauera sp.]|nr:sensor domain-containing diguanylate cyclase [Thauera sp.]
MNASHDPLTQEAPAEDSEAGYFERETVEQLLRDRDSLWHTLFAQSRDGVVVLDQNGRVYEANPRFAETLGYTMEEIYQLHVWDWAYEYTADDLLEMIQCIDADGHYFETRQMRKDGSVVEIELSNSRTIFRGQKLIFCICRDITERKEVERRIRILATTDTLTGVANRAEFSRRLNDAIARAHATGTPLGLVMFDLDLFKHINDTHGHDAGDAVLRGVIEVVREQVREEDVVGRWGGRGVPAAAPRCRPERNPARRGAPACGHRGPALRRGGLCYRQLRGRRACRRRGLRCADQARRYGALSGQARRAELRRIVGR